MPGLIFLKMKVCECYRLQTKHLYINLPIKMFLALIAINRKCYTGRNCQGLSFPMANASSCCVGTDDGMSYSEDGECIVRQCIGETVYCVYLHK